MVRVPPCRKRSTENSAQTGSRKKNKEYRQQVGRLQRLVRQFLFDTPGLGERERDVFQGTAAVVEEHGGIKSPSTEFHLEV